MRTSVISAFPVELIWHIVFYIDDRDDLLSLALIQRHFYQIIIPHCLDYHTIKCAFDKHIVWTHLAKQPASCKATKIVSLVKDQGDLEKKYTPRACRARELSYSNTRYDFVEVLPLFSNLQSFTWLDQSGDRVRDVLKALTDLNPPLTTLVIHHLSTHYHLLLKDLKPSNLSQLTHLEILSGSTVDNDVSLMHIILHAEKLTKLILDVPFDMTDVLKTYTWKNLKQLFLGNRVQFFPEEEENEDEDEMETDDVNVNPNPNDHENRSILTLFFQRHPLLEWLSLPLTLNDCFPLEDIFPHLYALDWARIITAIPASSNFTPHVSIAQRLDHYSSLFGEGWLPAFRDMSNLQSCCLRLNMDQVKHLEPLFQCAPRISRLRVELVGNGIALFGWIKRTIDIILKMNLPLTHLLSLFDDVDMGYQLGKENVERVGNWIPTLEYATGCVYGKTVFLKINRRYDAYTGFDVLYDPEAVNDPYLTNWGKF